MKEITRVHLAKTPYSIELDAKKELEKYLAAIEKNMRADADTLREIEVRMVELLAERGVKADGVVTDADVQALRQQMGEPTAFSDSEEGLSIESVDESGEKVVKRLMRDPDNAVLEGVCAGLASYFKIDVFWARILMVVFFFASFGVALIVYVVMAIAMPPARTAAEKLQMRGEKVTLNALRAASEEVGRGDKRNRLGMKFVSIFLGSIFVLIAFGLTIGLIVGGMTGVNIISLMDGFSAQNWAWGMWASLAIGGLAAISLAILFAQSSFTWKIKKASGVAMIAALTVLAFSISSVALFGVQTADSFYRDEKRLTKVVPIELPQDMSGVKYVRSDGSVAVGFSRDNDDKVRAELRYLAPKNVKAPKVTLERDGERLIMKVNGGDHDCPATLLTGLRYCAFHSAQVNFYGPIEYEPAPNGGPDSDLGRFEIPDQD